MIYLDLIFNLSLLVALSVVSGFIEHRLPRHRLLGALMQGVLFGGAAVIGMLRPLDLGSGLIFDGRSVMVSLCALFYGPFAALLACVMTTVCRLWIGGVGTLMGLLVIFSSATIGLLARSRLKPEINPPSTGNLYLFGMSVHLVMIALTFVLPSDIALPTVMRIGFPVILLYPLTTILVGKILSDQVATMNFVADLQHANQHLDITLRSIGDGVISTNLKGHVVFMNPVAEMLTGWKNEEAHGKASDDIFRIINAKTRKQIDNPVEKVLNKGEIIELSNHILLLSRDGTERLIADSAAPIRDSRNDINGVVLIFRDVTEDYRAREKLLESEVLFRNLFQQHAAVKMITDPDTGDIIEANEAAVNFYGWPIDELKKMKIQDISVISSEDVLIEMEKAGLQKHANYGLRHRKADGSTRDVEVFSSPIVIKRKNLHHSIIHDVTEHRRLEVQLRQAQKMESVGRLAGGVAHDFNNLLSVILGYSEMVLENLPKDYPYREPLAEIHNAGNRAKELTRQLLAFSRKQVLEMQTVDLNNVINDFEKLMRRIIGEDIELNLKLDLNSLPVKADPAQLEQVLMNLAVNARDAMPDGGKLTIETALVEIDHAFTEKKPEVIPGFYVMISLSDNGCGMDKYTLEQLFEPFFTTKDTDKGTGLGLATSYGIVRQHGGSIWVYSEPGRGSTFKIYLPLCDEKIINTMPPQKQHSMSSDSATVLVVEDDLTVRNLVVRILMGQGYHVIKSDNSEDAISKAKANNKPIHILLTDVIMPGMKGPEVYEKIRKYHPETKVLYMSGYTNSEIVLSGVLMEGVQFIQKPFTAKGLLEKLQQVIHYK